MSLGGSEVHPCLTPHNPCTAEATARHRGTLRWVLDAYKDLSITFVLPPQHQSRATTPQPHHNIALPYHHKSTPYRPPSTTSQHHTPHYHITLNTPLHILTTSPPHHITFLSFPSPAPLKQHQRHQHLPLSTTTTAVVSARNNK